MFRRRVEDSHVGPLAEFNALRAEILQLSEQQQKTTTVLITTTGAVFGFALSGSGRMPFLLIIPLVAYILCAQWVHVHDLANRAAHYIRVELDKKIPGGLGWEQWLREKRGDLRLRRVLTRTWTQPAILVYPAMSCLALTTTAVWFFNTRQSPATPMAIVGAIAWTFGLTITALSLALMLRSNRRIARGDFSY